jgi:hypothetical protein
MSSKNESGLLKRKASEGMRSTRGKLWTNTDFGALITNRDILQSTERKLTEQNKSIKHPILQRDFEDSMRSIKKQSQRELMGTREFLISTNRIRNTQMVNKSNYIELSLAAKKSLAGCSSPRGFPLEPSQDQSFTDHEPKLVDSQTLSFFMALKDKSILKLFDNTTPKLLDSCLARKDFSSFSASQSETTELLVLAVRQIFESVSAMSSEEASLEVKVTAAQLKPLQQIIVEKIRELNEWNTKAMGVQSQSMTNQAKGQSGSQYRAVQPVANSTESIDQKYFIETLEHLSNFQNLRLKTHGKMSERESEESSRTYNCFVDCKTILKVKSQIKVFSKLVDRMEMIFNDYWDKFNKIQMEQSFEKIQTTKFQELYETTKKSLEKERENGLKLQETLKANIGPDTIELSKNMEATYSILLTNLRNEVEKCKNERDSALIKISELEFAVSSLTKEKMKRDSDKQSKAVQAIFQIGAVKQSTKLLTDVVLFPEVAISTGRIQTKTWVCAMMNLIISSRCQFELYCERKQQPTKSIKDFIIDTFLIKFGSGQATQIMVMDFMVSLKEYCLEGERFKLFAKFIGMQDLLSNDIVKKKRSSKFEEFLTEYYYTSHLAARDYIEFCLLFKGYETNEETSVRPFVGFSIHKRTHLIKIETAKKLFCGFLLNRENKHSIDPELLEEEFDSLLKEDLYERLHEKGKEIKITNFKNEEFFISFDHLVRVLLEKRLGLFVSFVQKFLSALTINSAARGGKNLFFDDIDYSCKEVMPEMTEDQISHIFREIIDTAQYSSYSIEKMLQSAIPSIVKFKSFSERFFLQNLVLTKESFDEREALLVEAESKVKDRLAQNIYKKEGSKFKALINSLSIWKDKYLLKPVSREEQALDSFGECICRRDNISSLAAIQENYEILRPFILLAEKRDETIILLHQDVWEFVSKVPEKLVMKANFEEFKDVDATELERQLDMVWKKLRRIIMIAYYQLKD